MPVRSHDTAGGALLSVHTLCLPSGHLSRRAPFNPKRDHCIRHELRPLWRNPQVVAAFNDYRSYLLRIATLYAGARLIEALDLSALGEIFKLAISDDFPETATTIRTVPHLNPNFVSREYGQLALGLATIQLCTARLDKACLPSAAQKIAKHAPVSWRTIGIP